MKKYDVDYDNKCRVKFYELLPTYERKSGYSTSQVVSVMTVLDCDETEAMGLIDALPKYDEVDWSEATWDEILETFISLRKILASEVGN